MRGNDREEVQKTLKDVVKAVADDLMEAAANGFE
jgi:hypothetical protein